MPKGGFTTRASTEDENNPQASGVWKGMTPHVHSSNRWLLGLPRLPWLIKLTEGLFIINGYRSTTYKSCKNKALVGHSWAFL